MPFSSNSNTRQELTESSASTDPYLKGYMVAGPPPESPDPWEVHCYCGSNADIYTSWAGVNAGRMYYGCLDMDKPKGCNYIKWIDATYPERLKRYLLNLSETNVHLHTELRTRGNHAPVSRKLLIIKGRYAMQK